MNVFARTLPALLIEERYVSATVERFEETLSFTWSVILRGDAIDGPLYLQIARLYAQAVAAYDRHNGQIAGALELIYGLNKPDAKLDLLRDMRTNKSFATKTDYASYLSSVTAINRHVIERGGYSDLDEYLDRYEIIVPREWARLCDSAGFVISSTYIES
jgi:hypothetical protein